MDEKTVNHCRSMIAHKISDAIEMIDDLETALLSVGTTHPDEKRKFMDRVGEANNAVLKIQCRITDIIQYHEAYVRNKKEMEQNG